MRRYSCSHPATRWSRYLRRCKNRRSRCRQSIPPTTTRRSQTRIRNGDSTSSKISGTGRDPYGASGTVADLSASKATTTGPNARERPGPSAWGARHGQNGRRDAPRALPRGGGVHRQERTGSCSRHSRRIWRRTFRRTCESSAQTKEPGLVSRCSTGWMGRKLPAYPGYRPKVVYNDDDNECWQNALSSCSGGITVAGEILPDRVGERRAGPERHKPGRVPSVRHGSDGERVSREK